MKNRKQLKLFFLYATLGVLAVLFVIVKRESFSSFISFIFRILRPVIIGAIIAYLCNPIFRIFENRVFSGVRAFTPRRALSLIGTYTVLALIFVILLLLIIPQLLTSVLDFLENYETFLATALENINGLLASINSGLNLHIPPVKHETLKQGLDWIIKNINVDELMDRLLSNDTILVIFEYIGDTFFILTDVIFGLFISLYLLSGKEKIYAGIMRMRKALFNARIN
jgi:predicted PurR-regulated permease PerM